MPNALEFELHGARYRIAFRHIIPRFNACPACHQPYGNRLVRAGITTETGETPGTICLLRLATETLPGIRSWELVAIAKSNLSKRDRFSRKIGREVAFGRLLAALVGRDELQKATEACYRDRKVVKGAAL